MAQDTNVQDKPTDVTGAGLGTTANKGDHKLPENSKERLDEKLDQGVEETFPGSDPVSVKITK
jgi:hypothetical protein